ncbi:MAG: hypothetical protein ACXABO_19040 [Promethearchaeota archaeon]|jgi:Na+-translocating ferredoxin:NAD+ oxidoreductase RnfG subunit
MPCYLKSPRVAKIINELKENVKTQVLDELLKQNTDEELHQMDDEKIVKLILNIIQRLIVKKMKKEVEMIYI